MFKWIWKIVLLILVICAIVFGFFLYQGHAMYKDAIAEISLKDMIEKVQSDKNYVKIENLPVYYKNSVVSVEDRRFYEHGAVDPIAIFRAIVNNIRQGDLLEGGSTITQQVAKNLYFISNDTNSAYRKIAEIFVGSDLEKELGKDKILELYVNTIYFGDGYYGIKEACNGYLDKEPKDMTLYEATMMAGIPNAPSVYAPTANLNLTLSRQKKVISTMVENNYLTQEQADELISMQPEI